MNLQEKFIRKVSEKNGRAVGFRIDEVRLPNGKRGIREYLTHPSAVAVIPIVDRKRILMVRQYRHPVREITWEIPAGKLDPNESILTCVRRELEEETGFKARVYKKLISFWPTPAFSNEVIHIFVAKNLTKGRTNPDEDEFVKAKAWPLEEVFSLIRRGKIKDSKTIIAILAYTSFPR